MDNADVADIVDSVRDLEPGETGTWATPICKRTFPFLDPQVLAKTLENFPRPILDVEVYHKPNGQGYVAHIRSLN